jgi:uncharacterized YigZ family protein
MRLRGRCVSSSGVTATSRRIVFDHTMSDHYRTLAGTAEFRQKIERSEFLWIAFPVASDEAFFDELARIEKRFFDATHHCWAFRLFAGQRARSSDAGEPSGSAGKPILAALEGAGLHDVSVIVVRWYGGIKLGTGGLSRAYRETAAETLRLARPVDRYVYERIRVVASFDAIGNLYRLVRPPDILLVETRFGAENEFFFDVRTTMTTEFRKLIPR